MFILIVVVEDLKVLFHMFLKMGGLGYEVGKDSIQVAVFDLGRLVLCP